MTIRYLGYSSFLVKAKEAVAVIDPFSPDAVGLPFPKVLANIVLVSHDHPGHNNVGAVGLASATSPCCEMGKWCGPFVIDGPGEYELSGIKIWGFPSFHDDKKGAERGKNTIYLLEVEGLTLCHLGDLGHPLEEAVVKEIGSPHVLFIPTGGVYTIDCGMAAKVVAQLEPKIVVPMHFRVPGMKEEYNKLAAVSAFLEEMGLPAQAGAGEVTPQKELKVMPTTLPEETEVVVLERG